MVFIRGIPSLYPSIAPSLAPPPLSHPSSSPASPLHFLNWLGLGKPYYDQAYQEPHMLSEASSQ